jgi:hypothetical protein
MSFGVVIHHVTLRRQPRLAHLRFKRSSPPFMKAASSLASNEAFARSIAASSCASVPVATSRAAWATSCAVLESAAMSGCRYRVFLPTGAQAVAFAEEEVAKTRNLKSICVLACISLI